MKQEAIAVFSYQFPHRKTNDFLYRLFMLGYRNIHVLAAPKKKINRAESHINFETSLIPTSIYDTDFLCEKYGFHYIKIEHDDSTAIKKHLEENQINLGLIAGARILPRQTIELFKSGIVNFHPGPIPEASGLDTLYHTINKNAVSGVTTHFIDYRVDAGALISFDPVPINANDNFPTIIENLYRLELASLERLLTTHSHSKSIPATPIDRPYKNNILSDDKKRQILERFEEWKQEQISGSTKQKITA